MNNKLKHLEFIQNVIDRMARNSFMLKGWGVTIISALFALAASNTKISFVYLAYFPALIFWLLDGYFLAREKLFRKLYDKVRLLEEAAIDFSMDVSEFGNQSKSWCETIASKTLLIFHGGILLTIIIVMVVTLLSIQ